MSLVAVEDVTKTYRLGSQAPRRCSGVRTALEQVGLGDRARHRPAELSGGQQQRVAIARALVTDPAFVLAGEPTANLDGKTGSDVVTRMRRLNREHGTTFVFSTHDPWVTTVADRVLEISDGRLR